MLPINTPPATNSLYFVFCPSVFPFFLRITFVSAYSLIYTSHPRRCKTSSVGQGVGLSIPRSSVRFRQKLKKPRFSFAYLLKPFLLPQRVHTALFLRCDKPELTRWCLFSVYAGIQMSPGEVVRSFFLSWGFKTQPNHWTKVPPGSRDSCRHFIAEGTVDEPVPLRLFPQIFSARTVLFSCPFA